MHSWRNSLMLAACAIPLLLTPRPLYANDLDAVTPRPAAAVPSCVTCHPGQAEAFAASAMSNAASGTTFLTEWQAAGHASACLDCHAPSAAGGVTCVDCHADGAHPYARVEVPAACARCHDATGENTLRTFLESAAARQGKDCLDCHLPGTGPTQGHRFTGPRRDPARLPSAVVLRPFIETDPQGGAVLHLLIRHTAGHALPGGTTGRAIWLSVSATRAGAGPETVLTRRFGWEHDQRGTWRDRTLPADRWTVVSQVLDAALRGARLDVRLVYRFAPGPLTNPDARQVILAETHILPR